MNLSKYKRWRMSLHRVIAKQQSKIEKTHSVCLHAMGKKKKYKKVESANRQTCYLCFVNKFKFQENKFKIVQKNF